MGSSPTSQGDYGGFGAILEEARAIEEQLREQDRVDCPKCGSLLAVNSAGAASCPMGHYRASRYPKELE